MVLTQVKTEIAEGMSIQNSNRSQGWNGLIYYHLLKK